MSKSRSDGLYQTCKECVNSRRKAYREANPDKVKEQKKRYYEANRELHLEKAREWKLNNRDRTRAYNAEYREANREKLAENDRLYYRENREQRLESSQAWRERVSLERPWYESIQKARKRSRALGMDPGEFDDLDLLAYWAEQGIDPNVCYYTGVSLVPGVNRSIDHKIPLSDPEGPGNVLSNMYPCDLAFNAKKHNSPADVWQELLPQEAV